MAEGTPKVTLHWLDASRAQRIVWLLEECKGIDIDLKLYKRCENKLAPKELKKIHPLGKSPVVTIEAAGLPEPLVLAESAAITEYLCDHFAPHLIPKRYQDGKEGQVGGETETWLRYRFFMHYTEGSLMTLLLIGVFMDQIRNAAVPFFLKPVTRNIAGRVDSLYLNDNYKTHFRFLESQLASSPDDGEYLCGKDLTAADMMMSYPLISRKNKIDRQTCPKLLDYIARLENNDVYKQSIKRVEEVNGGPVRSHL
ncbi:hypothetical protein K431DRAFT_280113 [Polychaeton citri CBS 116435]|uniref:GST N-terminal domain-containing protein n=1 Tax=Polychaeton citri CBS 116435 TaxID=1314669 RepID=A0A9P4QJV0_9PEZI|nr:hypothetical protein K431DRAFT_280113 [Polychaeton citri CBS 116435]